MDATLKVSDLTIEQMKELIAETVRISVEELLEDFIASNSPGYLGSIREAREEYKRGEVTSLELLPR